MENTFGCETCRTSKSALLQIGETEHEEFFGGTDEQWTTIYECPNCKARWRFIKEAGRSGKGKFWSEVK